MKKIEDCRKWIADNQDADPELTAHRLLAVLDEERETARAVAQGWYMAKAVAKLSVSVVVATALMCGLVAFGLQVDKRMDVLSAVSKCHTDEQARLRSVMTAGEEQVQALVAKIEVEKKRVQALERKMSDTRSLHDEAKDHVAKLMELCR